MNSVSASFLRNNKVIVTKLNQIIKQIKLYTNCQIWGQKGRGLGHITYVEISGPLNIFGD